MGAGSEDRAKGGSGSHLIQFDDKPRTKAAQK
jgi:hypothetical protein